MTSAIQDYFKAGTASEHLTKDQLTYESKNSERNFSFHRLSGIFNLVVSHNGVEYKY